MNRSQRAILNAMRERMARQTQRSGVQRPQTVIRPGGADLTVRAASQDARQQIQQHRSDGTTKPSVSQSPTQQRQEQQVNRHSQHHDRNAGQVQAPVQQRENQLDSGRGRETEARGQQSRFDGNAPRYQPSPEKDKGHER